MFCIPNVPIISLVSPAPNMCSSPIQWRIYSTEIEWKSVSTPTNSPVRRETSFIRLHVSPRRRLLGSFPRSGWVDKNHPTIKELGIHSFPGLLSFFHSFIRNKTEPLWSPRTSVSDNFRCITNMRNQRLNQDDINLYPRQTLSLRIKCELFTLTKISKWSKCFEQVFISSHSWKTCFMRIRNWWSITPSETKALFWEPSCTKSW